MSTEKNMAIVRSLIEAENKHNTDLLDEFISPDLGTFDVDVSDTPKQTQGLVILKRARARSLFFSGCRDLVLVGR